MVLYTRESHCLVPPPLHQCYVWHRKSREPPTTKGSGPSSDGHALDSSHRRSPTLYVGVFVRLDSSRRFSRGRSGDGRNHGDRSNGGHFKQVSQRICGLTSSTLSKQLSYPCDAQRQDGVVGSLGKMAATQD